MSISPTLFIGLGEFGTTLSAFNHESFNNDFPAFSKLHASLNFNGDLTLTTANNPVEEVGSIPLFKENPVKENFEILNKEISKFKKAINNALEYVFDVSNAAEIPDLEDLSKKKKIIIYFSLGDTISSVSVQKTIELLTDSKFIKSLEIFLIGINYDLLDEEENRAYACLREIDFFLSTISSVHSVTLLSKYGVDNFGGFTKEDVIPLTYALSNKIIHNQIEIITSAHIRSYITKNNRKIIYNSFGSTSLVYIKDKVWQKFCDHEKIFYLSDFISKIEDEEFHRNTITAPVNIFIKQNSLKVFHQQLSTDRDGINLFSMKNFLEAAHIALNSENVEEFINLLISKDIEYNGNQWERTKEAIADNINNVNERYENKIKEDFISKINEEENGIVKLRAILNILLDQEHKSIQGYQLDDDESFSNLINDQLSHFKELYQRVLIDKREESAKEIVFYKDLKRLKKDIHNAEIKISGIKEEIVQLNRGFHHIQNEEEKQQTSIKDGYFTIAGEKVNINGCIQQDLDPIESNLNDEEKTTFLPKIESKNFKEMVDLREYLSKKIENQGMIGSCVTNAITSAIEYISNRKTGKFFPMSRMFLYYTARSFGGEGADLKDDGCNILQALLSAKAQGVCLESAWPYNLEKVNALPDSYAFVEAEKYKIDEFLRLTPNLEDMLSCLSEGYPFVFGLKITDSFGKLDGIIAEPSEDETRSDIHANHAMLCVGYNLTKKVFIVRNSWGKEWGDKGYCYIPFSYMTNPKMIFDVITIRSVDERVNEIIGKNIWGRTLGYFDEGVNNQQNVERLSTLLEEEKIRYQEKISTHEKMSEMLFNQDILFKDIGFRNSIEKQLQEEKDENIKKQEEELRANETNFISIQQNFDVLKANEKLFIYKWIGIPIAIITVLLVIAYFTDSLLSLVQFMWFDIISIFRGATIFRPIHLFNSTIWILLFSWTVYCAYKYFINYYLVFKKYKRERYHLEIKDKKDRLDIVGLYQEKWKFKFDYHVNTYLLEQVLKGVNLFISNQLDELNKFIDSLKHLREKVSGSYKELILKESKFSKNIFEIPDHNNIEEYYKNHQVDQGMNLEKEGFTTAKPMLHYFNEFIVQNNAFEDDITTHWAKRKDLYLKEYSLSELFDKNWFKITDIKRWSSFLKKYSTPLLDVSQSYLEITPVSSFFVYFSDNGFKKVSDQLADNRNDIKVHSHEDNDRMTIFRCINTFPAYYITCFNHLHGREIAAEHFIYDNTPTLEPTKN
jgi:C1A family cysteine protease